MLRCINIAKKPTIKLKVVVIQRDFVVFLKC